MTILQSGIVVSYPLSLSPPSINGSKGRAVELDAGRELRMYDLGRKRNWHRWWTMRKNRGLELDDKAENSDL